jgi:glycosyltransferase involved in cell wall biosynthesis
MKFTVLTPTYNRADCLGGVFAGLCAQSFRDFEWVIVDDGSTDGTKELVLSWTSFFPIRYIWKPNGGAHTALNVGLDLARGEFVTRIDSDDSCLPSALERFDYHWKNIPNSERFAILVSLCYKQDGRTILGSRFPSDVIDTFSLREALSLCDADRWSIIRTDVARAFRFPEFPGERFLVEGVVWNRMLKHYAARFFNEPLKIVGYAPGHLSGGPDLRWSSPRGAILYHTELVLSDVPVTTRFKSALNVLRFSTFSFAKRVGLLR